MTNPRDTGRWDAIAQEYVDRQVRIDFAWGNIPMQPDDDRGENTLNPALDSHEIAVFGYEGFPAFLTGYPYDDTKVNFEMPDVTGILPSEITSILNSHGGTGSWSVVDSSTDGATTLNDGKVKSQSPAAGTIVNYDQGVEVVVYEYVNLLTQTVPNLVGQDYPTANLMLSIEDLTTGVWTTSTIGATSSNWKKVKSQSPAAGTLVAVGTAVDYVTYDFIPSATTGSISGFNRAMNPMTSGWSMSGWDNVMFVTGHDVWPAVGSTFTVTGSSNSTYNTQWAVLDAVFDNAYNTGGTALHVQLVSGTFTGDTSTGGTWTKN
jgi:hypothetical protein